MNGYISIFPAREHESRRTDRRRRKKSLTPAEEIARVVAKQLKQMGIRHIYGQEVYNELWSTFRSMTNLFPRGYHERLRSTKAFKSLAKCQYKGSDKAKDHACSEAMVTKLMLVMGQAMAKSYANSELMFREAIARLRFRISDEELLSKPRKPLPFLSWNHGENRDQLKHFCPIEL